jgi:zinc transporter
MNPDLPASRSGLLLATVLDGQGGGTSLDWEGVAAWTRSDGVLWLHLDYRTADAEHWLGTSSLIDPLIQEALTDTDPRPRSLAVDGQTLLLVLRGMNGARGARPEDMVSVRCWIEPHRIITLRHRPIDALDTLSEDLMAGRGPVSAGDFLAALVEQTQDPLVTCVDQLDDAVAHAEDVALDQPHRQLREQLANLRRQAIGLRRFIAPQREALSRLAGFTLSFITAEQRARLRESGDRLTRTVEELDAARDRAAVTHEELQSRQSELSNQRLYVLSIITAIFLPLGFVTSLLGVNVGGVPGKEFAWGFWVLLGLLGCTLGLQVWVLRRRGWF